jgi:hypothetical protein
MTSQRFSGPGHFSAMALLTICLSSSCLLAQGPAPDGPVPDTPAPSVQPISPFDSKPSIATEQHKFWDKENIALFSATAAFSAGDFAVTYANLQNGGRELNPVVRIFGRSAPGLALNFGGQTAGVIGLSYFLHRTGHHKLERVVSIANMAASAGAISYGLAHR